MKLSSKKTSCIRMWCLRELNSALPCHSLTLCSNIWSRAQFAVCHRRGRNLCFLIRFAPIAKLLEWHLLYRSINPFCIIADVLCSMKNGLYGSGFFGLSQCLIQEEAYCNCWEAVAWKCCITSHWGLVFLNFRKHKVWKRWHTFIAVTQIQYLFYLHISKVRAFLRIVFCLLFHAMVDQ